jgi:membrane protease YdiL (CAAX protease family)
VRIAAPSPAAAIGPGAVAAAGLGFLLLRPGLEGLGAGARGVALAAGYVGLATGAAPRGGRRSRRAAPLGALSTLAVGLLAVLAAAALLPGPAPPLPAAGAAALALGLLAAVGEEALFRGALYAWLQRRAARAARAPRGARSAWRAALPPALAVAGSAVAFALVHVPSYGPAALPVDLGAGLLLGWQRWASGRWTVPAATHAAANLLAVILR